MTLRVEWLLSLGVVFLGCGWSARVEPLRGNDGGVGGGAGGGVGGGAGGGVGVGASGGAGADDGASTGGANHGTGGSTAPGAGATNGIGGAAGSADFAGAGGQGACLSQQGSVCGGGKVLGVTACSCAQGLVCKLPDGSPPDNTGTCIQPSACTYGGRTYQPGESFQCDCNQCTCINGNEIMSTTAACLGDGGGSAPDAGPSPCTYGAHTYQPGESFPCDCNQCKCISGNEIASTMMMCLGDGGAAPERGTAACDAAIHALSPKVSRGANMECSAVLRLDYQSYAPLGYSIACANEPSSTTTEAQAREIARTATGYPEVGGSDVLVSDPRPSVGGVGDELYVFVQSASDFGGSSVVHARNALALFGGSTVWAGTGHITYPTAWGSAANLGSGCKAAHPSYAFSPVHAYSLSGGGSLTGTYATAASQAMSAAFDTALPGALLEGTQAYLKGAVVLLYFPSVGGGDPNTGEWIIVMNAGWE